MRPNPFLSTALAVSLSLLAAGWTALGLLVVGAALLLVRRARRGGGEA